MIPQHQGTHLGSATLPKRIHRGIRQAHAKGARSETPGDSQAHARKTQVDDVFDRGAEKRDGQTAVRSKGTTCAVGFDAPANSQARSKSRKRADGQRIDWVAAQQDKTLQRDTSRSMKPAPSAPKGSQPSHLPGGDPPSRSGPTTKSAPGGGDPTSVEQALSPCRQHLRQNATPNCRRRVVWKRTAGRR